MKQIIDQITSVERQLKEIKSELNKIQDYPENDVNNSGVTYLTVDDLTAHLKLSKAVIYALRKNKMIPFVKIKNQYLFIKEEIDQWVLHYKDRISIEMIKERFDV